MRKREKEAEAGIASSSQDSSEERAQLHRDSASTLNRGSSAGGGSVGQSYELQRTESVEVVAPSTASLSVCVAGPAASVSVVEEGNSQQVCVCVREREREYVCMRTCLDGIDCYTIIRVLAYGRM